YYRYDDGELSSKKFSTWAKANEWGKDHGVGPVLSHLHSGVDAKNVLTNGWRNQLAILTTTSRCRSQHWLDQPAMVAERDCVFFPEWHSSTVFVWVMKRPASMKAGTAAMKASRKAPATKAMKTMKSMKATKAGTAMKAMQARKRAMKVMKAATKRPATKKDDDKKRDNDNKEEAHDDCGPGGARDVAPRWAVPPFYVGDEEVECAQLEGRCWIMSESVPLTMTIGSLLQTMRSTGCGRGFSYEPIGLAVAVRAHRKDADDQDDDKGSDDDKKKDDDSPKDDGEKKDDDPEESEPEESSTHSMTPGPYRLVCPDDGIMDDDSPKDDDKKKDDDDREPHTPPEWIPGHVYNSVTRRHEPLE
ncbi:unnamed protein product, partial [Symbiodinium sp. KB8]